MSFETFKAVFNVKTNFLTYTGVVQAIKQFCKSLRLSNLNTFLQSPFSPFHIYHLNKQKTGSQYYYKILIKHICERNSHFVKWEYILGHEINEQDRKSINSIPFSCTKVTELQWFQYQLLHHILPTNCLLFKMGYVDSIKCSYCSKEIEDVTHLFWECKKVSSIWRDLERWISYKLQNPVTISKEDVLFGYLSKNNNPLNLVIILSKRIIFNFRKNKYPPAFQFIQKELAEFYKLTKYTSVINCNRDYFNKVWSNCHALFP